MLYPLSYGGASRAAKHRHVADILSRRPSRPRSAQPATVREAQTSGSSCSQSR
jgi:hypothetical protein